MTFFLPPRSQLFTFEFHITGFDGGLLALTIGINGFDNITYRSYWPLYKICCYKFYMVKITPRGSNTNSLFISFIKPETSLDFISSEKYSQTGAEIT